MKTALYTVCTGEYDTVNAINPNFTRGIDCYLFTDGSQAPDGWIIKKIPNVDNSHRQQREIKIMFHKFLSGYDRVIFIDANMKIVSSLDSLLRQFKGGMLTVKHPDRNCVYAEGFKCIELHKAQPENVKPQLADYIMRGVPPQSGMYATCLIIRDNSSEVKSFCKLWKAELDKGCHRDQLAIMAARHEMPININTIQWNVMQRYFRHQPHVNRSKKKIHYIVPYNTDKNIGKAINDAIDNLKAGPDDWIVLRDGDTCYLTPQWGKHIEDALMKVGDYFDLIGCMTNRIGGRHQQEPGMFDETDMIKHYEKAVELQEKKYAVVEEIKDGVAGYFMAFPKRVWDRHHFPDNDITFDTKFYKEVRKNKGRVGLMRGFYIFHMYRLWAGKDARVEKKHLVK